ncbi:MAG TPA: hypothetical protein VF276_05620 [Chloroflexia bacterium]
MGSQDHARPEYLSYLLRLWHTHSGGETVWRAALEDPLTREVVRFDNLAGLFAFLSGRIGEGGTEGSSAPAASHDNEGSIRA